MKIYNIRNSKCFFEKLSECRDTVEIITSDGATINSSAIKGFLDSPLAGYMGHISEIELVFSSPCDLDMILSFVMGQRQNAA